MVFTVVVIYLVFTSLIGFWAYLGEKKKQSADSFMVNKGKSGLFVVVATQVSMAMAAGSSIGTVEDVFKIGLTGGWIDYFHIIVHLAIPFLVVGLYAALNKAYGCLTVPSVFGVRFDEKVHVLSVVTISFFYLLLFSMQPAAAARILAPMLQIDSTTAAWIAGGIFVLVVMFGGMKGIAWMNVVHCLVMLFGMTWAGMKSLQMVGGLGAMASQLPENYLNLFEPNLQLALGNVCALVFGNLFNSFSFTVTLSAKNVKTAKRGIFIAAFVIALYAMTPTILGLTGKILHPDAEVSSIFSIVASSYGPVISCIVFMAITAAIFSTAPSCLLMATNSLTKDIFCRMKPEADDKEIIRFSRIVCLIAGVAFIALGVMAPSVTTNAYRALNIGSITGIVLLVSIFWRRVTSNAAFWAILIGSIVAGVWSFAGNLFGIAAFWPAAGITLMVLTVLTLMSKESTDAGFARIEQAKKDFEGSGISSEILQKIQ